jgi:hypothetical protein
MPVDQDSCAPILQQVGTGATGEFAGLGGACARIFTLGQLRCATLQQLTETIRSVGSVYAEIIEWQA